MLLLTSGHLPHHLRLLFRLLVSVPKEICTCKCVHGWVTVRVKICVHYCIDVAAVVEIKLNSIQFKSRLSLIG